MKVDEGACCVLGSSVVKMSVKPSVLGHPGGMHAFAEGYQSLPLLLILCF